jgi:hypothetical protein
MFPVDLWDRWDGQISIVTYGFWWLAAGESGSCIQCIVAIRSRIVYVAAVAETAAL